MSDKNYTSYSKMSAQETTVSNTVDMTEPTAVSNKVDGPVFTEKAPTNVVENPTPVTSVDPEPEVTPPPPIDGKVFGCERLNIRKLPDKNAEILGVIAVDSKVMIIPGKSTENWFAVYTEAGLEGYCMKKYISMK